MNINELINLISTSYLTKRPVLALSSPGIGKSSAVYQAAASLSKQFNETFHVIELRAATANPAETADVKFIKDGAVANAPQSWFPTDQSVAEGTHPARSLIFLDEIADGPLSTQSAFQQILLDRRLGSLKLAKGWHTVAASNRAKDKAAAGRLSTALINRCLVTNVEPDTDEFVSWGMKNALHPSILAYVRWRPSCWNFDPSAKNENPAFCSPRSMHILSDFLKVLPNPSLEVVSGCVGDGVGTEFFGFLKIMEELPDLDLLCQDQTKVKAPTRIDVAIAIMYALIPRITAQTGDQILKFFSRLDREVAINGVRDALKLYPEVVAQSPAFIEWASDKTIVRLLTTV